MMGETSEHPREFPRFEVNAYVDYTGNEVLLFHRIQTISLGGVCIQTTGNLPRATRPAFVGRKMSTARRVPSRTCTYRELNSCPSKSAAE